MVITSFAIGHDGNHALLVGEEGVVYFTGTPKRGEDGDQSTKQRRPLKVRCSLYYQFINIYKTCKRYLLINR